MKSRTNFGNREKDIKEQKTKGKNLKCDTESSRLDKTMEVGLGQDEDTGP
jgi:hypothetical protein